MAGKSIIALHPLRAEIESAIAAGVQGKIIARQYGVSQTAISRYKNGAMARTAESNEAESNASSADTLVRLIELAESTRRARQLADRTGSPAVKAAAQRAELAVLDRLTTKLGVTDLSVLAYSAVAADLQDVVLGLVTARPDIRADVIGLMAKRSALNHLAERLSTPEKKK